MPYAPFHVLFIKRSLDDEAYHILKTILNTFICLHALPSF